jgi:outer membrane lipase/esterase
MRKLLITTLACVSVLGAVPATAATIFSDLFVFGDSLVDSGNARAARLATGGADPAPPSLGYFEGRFSNGFNFADYLSLDLFGRPATASIFGGSNFSVGGAQAAEVVGDASPSFAEQLALFNSSGQTLSGNSLVLVTFGGNDIRGELAEVATIPGAVPNLSPAVSALNANLASLVELGARNIIVTGLPDVGQIPGVTGFGSPALSALGTQLSFGLNQAFGQTVNGLATQTGYNLQFFDLFAYQTSIYKDPVAFGLPASLDTTRACLQVPGAAPECNGFVYFDAIHPTTQVHRVIASGLTAQVSGVPEPATWAMMLFGFGAVGYAMRKRGVSYRTRTACL